MNDELNPYSAPRAAAEVVVQQGPTPRDMFALVAWPVVFGLNLIVPLLLGWMVTERHGRLGMLLALGMFLLAGWMLCYFRGPFARRLILGALFAALSQFLPLLQLLSGLLALAIAKFLGFGLNMGADAGPTEQLTSEFAGFFVTFLVGLILSLVALGMGFFLNLVLPQRWFTPATPPTDE